VRLTPEENVRQSILQWLVEEHLYPHHLIAVEVPIKVGSTPKRCDAIVYNKEMQPLMLIEFKAPSIAITQEVFDQAAIYNRQLNVPLLLLSNGQTIILARVTKEGYQYLPRIPAYTELSPNT
jgi:type I site-specific restriction endonuclease